MVYIYNTSTDPYFNMACEEYLLKCFFEDVFMLWQNDNTIVIGKNQNTLSEINYSFVKENNINVVRRLSGGGAVYHDKGNINFTYITDYDRDFFSDFDFFTNPVIDTLKDLGIKAQLQGRNDISIEGLKFSGNSQVVKGGRILHHGTIMLDVNLDILSKGLFIKKEKIESKGIKSVKKRVTNINDYLKEKITPLEFIRLLSNNFKKNNQGVKDYTFTDSDVQFIEKLAEDKYRTWEWNFGKSPNYNITKNISFPGGNIELYMSVEKGIIREFDIYGDFFGEGDIKDLCDALVGLPHNYDVLLKVFTEKHLEKYIYSLNDIDNFVKEMF